MSLTQAGIHDATTKSISGVVNPHTAASDPQYQSWRFGPPAPVGDASYGRWPNIVLADPTIANATAPTWITTTANYFPLEDNGALSRPSSFIAGNCLNSSSSYNPNPTIIASGTRLQLSLCEALALIAAGAARAS